MDQEVRINLCSKMNDLPGNFVLERTLPKQPCRSTQDGNVVAIGGFGLLVRFKGRIPPLPDKLNPFPGLLMKQAAIEMVCAHVDPLHSMNDMPGNFVLERTLPKQRRRSTQDGNVFVIGGFGKVVEGLDAIMAALGKNHTVHSWWLMP